MGPCASGVKEMKYLGVTIVSFRTFKISTEKSRRAFHRTANAIFGCIGRVATEEVVLQLLRSVCQFCYMALKLVH